METVTTEEKKTRQKEVSVGKTDTSFAYTLLFFEFCKIFFDSLCRIQKIADRSIVV